MCSDRTGYMRGILEQCVVLNQAATGVLKRTISKSACKKSIGDQLRIAYILKKAIEEYIKTQLDFAPDILGDQEVREFNNTILGEIGDWPDEEIAGCPHHLAEPGYPFMGT